MKVGNKNNVIKEGKFHVSKVEVPRCNGMKYEGEKGDFK